MTSAMVVSSGLRPQLVGGLAVALALAPGWWAPAQLATHGGAAVIAYLVAMLLVGLPWVWYECAAATCLQSGLPETLRRTCRRWEWLGWWGALLAALFAVLAVVTAGWALWQGLRTLLVVLSGTPVVRGGLPPDLVVEPAPSGGAATATVAVALVVGLVIAGGYLRALRRLAVVVLLAVALALALPLFALASPAVAGAVIAAWELRPGALLEPGLWLGAGAWALLTVVPMIGAHALIAARRPRTVDVGASALLVVVLAAAGNLVLAQALVPLLAVAESAGRPAALPLLITDPVAVLDPGAPRLDAGLMATGFAAMAAAALAGACLFAGSALDALRRSGPALRRLATPLWALLALTALVFVGDLGRHWVSLGLPWLLALALTPLVALTGRVVARQGDLRGIIDHAQVHASLPLHQAMRPWLAAVLPTVALVAAGLGVLGFFTTAAGAWWTAVLPAALLALGVVFGALALARLSRLQPERLAPRFAKLLATATALAALGVVLWSVVTAGARARVMASERALLAPSTAMAAEDPTLDLLALARRAWDEGRERQARHVLDLAHRHAEGLLPITTDTKAWSHSLATEAIDRIAERPVAARAEILARLRVLRRLPAGEQVAAVERMWRRQRPIDEDELQPAWQALAGDGDRLERLAAFVVAWRRAVGPAANAPSLAELTAAPEPLGSDAQRIGQALLAEIDAARAGHPAPAVARRLLAAVAVSGLEADLDPPRRRWLADQRGALASPWAALGLFLPLAVGGLWTVLVVLMRTRLGPLPIDPSADTLLHVDPIDVDTQEVTAAGEETGDQQAPSSPTTSGTGLAPVRG